MISIAWAATDHQNPSRSGNPLPDFGPRGLSKHRRGQRIAECFRIIRIQICQSGWGIV